MSDAWLLTLLFFSLGLAVRPQQLPKHQLLCGGAVLGHGHAEGQWGS